MNFRDLFFRVRALVAPHRVERELDEELAFHIERETQKHIAAGLSPVHARSRALARFGPVPLAADQCRDARGIGLVDDLARDIQYAFRTFRRARLAALTIVATVALGLGLIAAVFAVYSTFFLRVDAVPNPGELFAVERLANPSADAALSFTRPEYEALRRETDVFTDAFAMRPGGSTGIEGRRLTSVLVTDNFFQALGVQAALGRPLTPGDEERFAGRPVIVLSHMGWTKLFAGEPNVIGRHVLVNELPCEIVGVMPEGFRGLLIGAPDYWAPLALAGQFHAGYAGRENEIAIDIVGRLNPGMSPEAAAARLTAWDSARTDPKTVPRRPISVKLAPRQGTLSANVQGHLLIFAPIFLAFGLILMIGCANVANLLLARGVSRQREIGIRLSLGASRRRVIRQLLTESLLLALAAAACGLALSRLALMGTRYAATSMLPPELWQADITRWAPATDWRVVVFLAAGAIVCTAFFGLAPALQATHLDLVPTMRGELTRDSRPGGARQALIAVQVGASALLLICAAIFLRGAFAAATSDPSVRTSDTVRVSIETEPRRAALLQALRADPLVAVVAASSPPTRGVVETSVSPSRMSVGQLAVSSEYFNVLGYDLVHGRGFTPAERTAEAGVVVMSDTIARQLWPNGNGVGQVVRLEAPQSASLAGVSPPPRTLTVVGIVSDPGRASGMSYLDTFGGVYLPADPETSGTWLFLRVRGNPELARLALLERLTSIDPALGNVITLGTMAGMQTYILQIAFWVTVVLGGLALVLTVSGLFSVLSYLVEQQAKEIGVRMALGATATNVAGRVLSQSARPVGIGLVAGGGLAVALAIVLMATPAGSEIGGFVRVFDPLAYVASALVIITACLLATSVPALRAARLDPIATLRQD